jgi:hypothetical protein
MVYSLARRAFRRAAGSPAASGALEVGGGRFPVSGHGPGHWGAAACERPARRRLTRASSAPPSPTEVSTWPPTARSRSRGPLRPFVSATAVGSRSADAADSTTGSSEAAGLPGQKDPSSAMVVISREYHGADLRSRPLYRHPAARTQSCICLPKGCATHRCRRCRNPRVHGCP